MVPYLLSEEELLRECEVHRYRARGPGGQKRNTTDSAVRIVHRPTGVSATATESRSQHENRRRALRRLREALALHCRSLSDLEDRLNDQRVRRFLDQPGRVRIRESNDLYPLLVGLWLDALEAAQGRIAEAAHLLGLASSSKYVRFLADHPHLWTAANAIRHRHGLPPLKKP